MRKKHYQNIALFVLILSVVVVFSPQDVFASEITYPVNPGSNTVQYRDITNTDPTPPLMFSFDKDSYNKGETAILTIEDFCANLDVTVPEFTNADIIQPSSTTTVEALETGDSTAVFDGDFEVTDKITSIEISEDETENGDAMISYDSVGPECVRSKITLPLSTGGNVHLNDEGFDENKIINAGIIPVTGAINVILEDGASFSSVPTVEISFANANLDDGNISILDLEMWHKAPGQNWEKITDSCNTKIALFKPCSFFDNTAKTITSDPTGEGFSGTDGQGAYVLLKNTGIPGGGGGGLVRPSLVVNALAGIGGAGGGTDGSPPIVYLADLVQYSHLGMPLEIEQMVLAQGSTPISPMEIGLFEGFDYPMTINDKGFVLGQFSNTIQTQTIKTGSPAVIKFILYETTKIQHVSLYLNLMGANTQVHQSDTQLLFNDGLDLQKKDPNGLISEATVTINDIDENKKEAVFEITFAKEMDTSDMIIRSWDPYFNSRDIIILDAIQVVPAIVEESPIPIGEEPIIEELQSQSIPIWIKNNAAWWSEQQIGDNDFVSGIEYLITNGIINVPGVEVSTGSVTSEIPDWIKNNAGWWADSLITDEDFIEGIQWLVANGVIQI